MQAGKGKVVRLGDKALDLPGPLSPRLVMVPAAAASDELFPRKRLRHLSSPRAWRIPVACVK